MYDTEKRRAALVACCLNNLHGFYASLQTFFKVGHSPSKKNVICFNDSPSKMTKNAFFFHLKSSFRSKDV